MPDVSPGLAGAGCSANLRLQGPQRASTMWLSMSMRPWRRSTARPTAFPASSSLIPKTPRRPKARSRWPPHRSQCRIRCRRLTCAARSGWTRTISRKSLSNVKELRNTKKDGDVVTADAIGAVYPQRHLQGIDGASQTDLPQRQAGARLPGKNGDLLIVRATFAISRGDYNIQPHQNEAEVSDKIGLTLALAGASAKGE